MRVGHAGVPLPSFVDELRHGIDTLDVHASLGDLSMHIRMGATTTPTVRESFPNPLINAYQAGDGRWFWLLGLQAARHWPDLIRAMERSDLLEHPDYADIFMRAEHAGALIAIFDEHFATRPRDHWADSFDREGMWWAPVNSVDDLVDDVTPQTFVAYEIIPRTVISL